jgi:hypothetical protein
VHSASAFPRATKLRRHHSEENLPGERAQFNYFSGAGKFLDTRLSDDPKIAKQCAAAFEAVGERAIPHQDYQLR